MDPLADVLAVSGVSGALMANVKAQAPWGLDLPQSSGASFHAVTSGSGWIRVAGEEPRQFFAGDLLLLPAGAPHAISSDLDTRCRPFDRAAKEFLISAEGDLRLPGEGAGTTFICAAYDYDHEVTQPLMTLLPTLLHVPAEPVAGTQIAAVVSLLAGEVGTREPGARAATARLIDLLLIHAVRQWATTADGDASWLRALRDPTVAAALAALHERPEEPWTLAKLASEVHVSRATVARRFSELVGETPSAYLTRWRMDLAARRLRDTADPVEQVARSVGYSSEYAFNRAFSRHRGQPPGRYRLAASAAVAA